MTASHQHPDTLPNALSWANDAACKDEPQDLFFTDSKKGIEHAKRICARCPVREECLAEALRAEDGSRYGISGGLTPDEWAELVRGPERKRGRLGGGKPPAPCGTRSAYERHIRNDEPIDQACTDAYAKHLEEKRERKRKAGRALTSGGGR